jgi:ankyrin repeat protein
VSGSLPNHPNFDQLRRRAKELRDALRAGDRAAVDRVRRTIGPESDVPAKLSTAQLVIARELGYASWPKLKAEVESRLATRPERVRAFLLASCQQHFMPGTAVRDARAARLLADDPTLATHDIRTAAVLGEVEHVRRLLATDPDLVNRPDPESGAPPLVFVCLSQWHRVDPGRTNGMLEVARSLLDAGADPNASIDSPPWPSDCSPLYAAAGLANNPPIAQLLLERGADPDTEKALYHTAFHPDHECLRLLLAHGATAEGGDALAGAITTRDVGAVRLLLEAGVDPGQRLGGALGERYDDRPPIGPVYAAIEFDGPPELVGALLEHGSDPDTPGWSSPDEWQSPYRLALRRGRTDLVEILQRFGATDDTDDVDRLLAACAQADRALAEHIATKGAVLDQLSDADRGAALIHAADSGQVEAVRLMLDLGFDVDARGRDQGETALHMAAASGSAELRIHTTVLGHGGQRATTGKEPLPRSGRHGTNAARRGRFDRRCLAVTREVTKRGSCRGTARVRRSGAGRRVV